MFSFYHESYKHKRLRFLNISNKIYHKGKFNKYSDCALVLVKDKYRLFLPQMLLTKVPEEILLFKTQLNKLLEVQEVKDILQKKNKYSFSLNFFLRKLVKISDEFSQLRLFFNYKYLFINVSRLYY